MKKTLLIMVMALAVLLTQCRKPEVKFPSPVAPEGTTVSMTVTAGPGSKTDITPVGGITWSTGDKLYVGDGSKYIGYLTIVSGQNTPTGTFTGDVTLTGISEGTPHTFGFYYLGSAERTLTVGATTADVDFSSQNIYAEDGKLKNASAQHVGYGTASGTVKDGIVTGINVTLVSKVALARFSFTESDSKGAYDGALILSGTNIYNKMKVNFSASGFDFTPVKDSNISLTGGHGERYVMLVPAGTSAATLNFGGGAEGTTTLANGIEANKFYGRDGAIEVEVTPFEFTVGMDSDTPITVQFSPGNLYCDGSAFKFEANQWDFANSWNSSYVSHFYWSKSADVAVAVEYEDAEDNFFTNATDTTANPSFHVNGETGTNQWRTLSGDEWSYLIGESAPRDASLREWSAVTFGESGPTVSGLIIMPDGWEGNLTETTEYTTWQELEASGAVFLPAAGGRYGTDVISVGLAGGYWSSTPDEDYEGNAYYVLFNSDFVSAGLGVRYYNGDAVRLVR